MFASIFKPFSVLSLTRQAFDMTVCVMLCFSSESGSSL